MKISMKNYVLVLALVLMLSFVACSQVPENATSAVIADSQAKDTSLDEAVEFIPIDTELSSFEFEGYAPGKSHIGNFSIWSGELGYDASGKLVSAKGIIDPSTADTGIDGLNNHLMSDDFFDVENYPEIKIESTSINYLTGELVADLTFHGVTKSVTFPVEITEDGIKADFLLDTTPFNIKYVGINKDVRVAFEFLL